MRNRTLSQLLLIILIILFCPSLKGQQKINAITNNQIISQTEICRSNPLHSYEIFLPSVDTSFKQIPLLIAFAPNADAKMAVNWFKETAQKYKIIVAASYRIKSNDSSSLLLLDEMIADIRTKFDTGKYLFIGGSSLGTTLGIDYSINHRVDGLLSMGMMVPLNKMGQIHSRLWEVIDPNDFNFVEIAPLIIEPRQIPSNLLLEPIDTLNKESQKRVLQQEMTYLLITTIPPGTPAEKKKIVQTYVAEQKARIDYLIKTGNYILASLITRNMFQFQYFEREFSFFNFYDQLTNEVNYLDQIDKLNQSVQFEIKVRNEFYKNILAKDSIWWQQDINLIDSKLNTEKDEWMLAAYKRIRKFVGVFCYSMCERCLEDKDAPSLEKVLIVYKMAEPKNANIQQFEKKLEQLKNNH